MTGEKAPVSWRFWLWWVLASTVGWAVGGGLSGTLGSIQAGYVGGMTVGATGAGMLQWLVLRQRIDRAGWWVLATVLASAGVGALIVALGFVGGRAWGATWSADPGRVVGGLAGMGFFGTVLGALQWLVLRRQVARAGWWVLAGGGGWVAGAPIGAVLGGGLSGFLGWSGSGTIDWSLTWAGVGAVYGAITGRVLVWLLRQPMPAAASEA